MNRIRLVLIGTMLMLALTTVAQQTAQPAMTNDSQTNDAHGQSNDGVPAAEKHLQVLTEKLDLTADQQAKVKPILQQMQDSTQKFMQDESMSRGERMDNVKLCRYKADKEIRKVLSDDQKKELDQLEEEHPDLHGK
jgi:Spy/CpxP family protein refolding chaperone